MTVNVKIDNYEHSSIESKFQSKVEAVVSCVVSNEGGVIFLEGGQTASQAYSCLVEPKPGDTVLVCSPSFMQSVTFGTANATQPAIVLSILHRPHPENQTLCTPGVNSVTVKSSSIRLIASCRIQTVAGKAIEMISGAGSITQHAKDVTLSAANNLVSIAKRCLTKGDLCDVEAKDILTIKGGHGLIEAKNEIRMNAKHINMG